MAEERIVQKVVLAGLVMKDGKVLLLKRSADEAILPGLWELPSGKKEPLEGWREALVREVREETGLAAEPVAPVSVFDYVTERPDETRDTTQINFLMRPDGRTEVSLSEEHDDYAWLDESELDSRNISEGTKNALRAVFAYGK